MRSYVEILQFPYKILLYTKFTLTWNYFLSSPYTGQTDKKFYFCVTYEEWNKDT